MFRANYNKMIKANTEQFYQAQQTLIDVQKSNLETLHEISERNIELLEDQMTFVEEEVFEAEGE